MSIDNELARIGQQFIATSLLFLLALALWFIRDRRWLCGCHLATRGYSLLLLGFTFLFALPRSNAVLIGFGTELPGITVLVIELSNLAYTLWPFLVVFIAAGLTAETILFDKWLQPNDRASRAKWCSFTVTCGLALLLLFCETAVEMGFTRVLKDLQ